MRVSTYLEGVTVLASAVAPVVNITWDGQIPSGGLGRASVQIVFTGTGTAKIEWLASNDGVTYATPVNETTTDIGTTLATGAVCGWPIEKLYKHLQLKVTEDGGANPITITGLYVAMG